MKFLQGIRACCRKGTEFLSFLQKGYFKNFLQNLLWAMSTLSVPYRLPPFNISVTHKNHTFSASKIPQFNTKNPSLQHQNPLVQHQKPLSSTLETPQFHIKTPSVLHQKPLSSTHPSVPHTLKLKNLIYNMLNTL